MEGLLSSEHTPSSFPLKYMHLFNILRNTGSHLSFHGNKQIDKAILVTTRLPWSEGLGQSVTNDLFGLNTKC